jgi:hypothetical protein
MNKDNDTMWSAYLDGELSTADAAAFDRSLTPDDRVRLANELAFERSLAESLGHGAACPAEVWDRVRAKLEVAGASGGEQPVSRWYWKPAMSLAAVATVVIAISWFAIRVNLEKPVFLAMSEVNVKTMADITDIPSPTLSDLNAYLEDHNLDVAVTPFHSGRAGHHAVRVLGVKTSTFRNEQVVELLFNCCGKPLRVALVPQGGYSAEAAGKALGNGLVQETRPVGSTLAVMIGRHPSPDLLSHLTDKWAIALDHI